MTAPRHGGRWRRVPARAPRDPAAARFLGAPLTVRRSAVVPALSDSAWTVAVLEAERRWEAGLESGTPDDRRWLAAGPGWKAELHAATVPGGVALKAAHTRSAPRPWLTALALLCGAPAVACAVALSGRPSAWGEWAVVLALLAVPVVAMVASAAAVRVRSRRLGRRLERILRRADRAAWTQATVIEDDVDLEVDMGDVTGPEWLDADEWPDAHARPAHVEPDDLRHARRVVARPVADERRPEPVPTSVFVEWTPQL